MSKELLANLKRAGREPKRFAQKKEKGGVAPEFATDVTRLPEGKSFGTDCTEHFTYDNKMWSQLLVIIERVPCQSESHRTQRERNVDLMTSQQLVGSYRLRL